MVNWTTHDLQLLHELVARHGRNWILIAADPRWDVKRQPTTISQKWRVLQRKKKKNTTELQSSIRKQGKTSRKGITV